MGPVSAIALLLMLPAATAGQDDFEGDPIHYGSTPGADRVARMGREIEEGKTHLERRGPRGYLDSLLEALQVPVSSQTLVFSKTSFQRDRISPTAPRAIYYSDDVYVGWVRGAPVLEIAAVDPRQGVIFYVLEQKEGKLPRPLRQDAECLQCHASSSTRGVPGLLVRSVYPDPEGLPVLGAGSFLIDHRSPIEERWGGWYVTGTHRPHLHLGNATLADADHPERMASEAGANLTDLRDRCELSAYPAPHSDIVALMVLEHQTQAQNLITAAGYQGRKALRDLQVLRDMGMPAGETPESFGRRLGYAAEPLLRYLLFSGEARLQGQIRGTSSFARDFASRGPFDRKGRSLRELDLERRLLRYPLSPLIYSASFDALPEPVKERFYARLHAVLTGEDRSAEFSHLSDEDRRAVLEILLDTKPGLPAGWKPAARGL